MDKQEVISLSQIATIISNNSVIKTTSNSTWERILTNAGLPQLYSAHKERLHPYKYYRGYQNTNEHFEEFYSAIHSILKYVYTHEDKDEFLFLMSSIFEEIDISNLIKDEKDPYSIAEKIEARSQKSSDEFTEDLLDYAKEDFKKLIANLNVINLDIIYKEGVLWLRPFTNESLISRNNSILLNWLNERFPEIGEQYKEAINNYIAGESVSCISNCRNIITGLFSQFKNDGNTSWAMGLKNLSTDTYIENVDVPRNIIQGSANKYLNFENGKQFKYPRFQLIHYLYTLASDLGSHSTEAPKINGELYPENTTTNDALLCLRMTEDVLIWTKNRLNAQDAND